MFTRIVKLFVTIFGRQSKLKEKKEFRGFDQRGATVSKYPCMCIFVCVPMPIPAPLNIGDGSGSDEVPANFEVRFWEVSD